ncbi:MAG: hypothetical protein FWD23_18150 [Oscillospiraceae bacterium]|nr:hypothetical protein [Oscillospiraceae bacterium]
MIKRLIMIMILMLCVGQLLPSVYAAPIPSELDLDRKGELIIILTYNDNPLNRFDVRICRVAKLQSAGSYILTDEFNDLGIILTGEIIADQNKSVSAEFDAYASKNNIKRVSQRTGPDGIAVFHGLEAGVYLVTQNVTLSYGYIMTPYLVQVPYPENTEDWIYSVESYPKVNYIPPEPPPIPPSPPPIYPPGTTQPPPDKVTPPSEIPPATQVPPPGETTFPPIETTPPPIEITPPTVEVTPPVETTYPPGEMTPPPHTEKTTVPPNEITPPDTITPPDDNIPPPLFEEPNDYDPPGPDNTPDNPKNSPKTGDESPTTLYTVLFYGAIIIMLGSAGYLLICRRSGKETEIEHEE